MMPVAVLLIFVSSLLVLTGALWADPMVLTAGGMGWLAGVSLLGGARRLMVLLLFGCESLVLYLLLIRPEPWTTWVQLAGIGVLPLVLISLESLLRKRSQPGK